MGPLPKRKGSKARQGDRRSHLALKPPAIEYCPQCHSPKMSHHVCPVCGTYAGRQVVTIESSKKTSE